jgi:tRNA threonylcarbamoyladenosine biosynthesis protein TsaE
LEAISGSPSDTQSIGVTLGQHAGPGDVFLLVGDLGAGKTCLAQGVLWGLGGTEFARSPSFVLAAQYSGRLTMYHIDLFRLDSPYQVLDIGLDEYLQGDGVCVVEWADKAPDLFTEPHLRVRLERLDETTRKLTLSSSSPTYAHMLSALGSDSAPE